MPYHPGGAYGSPGVPSTLRTRHRRVTSRSLTAWSGASFQIPTLPSP